MIKHYISCHPFCKPNSLAAAMIDWLIVGIHGGFRRNEWCQDQGHSKLGTEEITHGKVKDRLQAFTINDIEFLSKTKRKMSMEQAMDNTDLIWYVRLRFHWQKNLNNNKKKLFVVNTAKPGLCPVKAWIRIIQRYRSIAKKANATTLLVYYDYAKGVASNITTDEVINALRLSAKALYDLDNDELNAFKCHSI